MAGSYEAPFRRSAKGAPMEQAPRVVSSRRCFNGRVFGVRVDQLRLADGSEQRVDVVEHSASVAVVATPAPDTIVLVRQYRHAANAALWEIPAGMSEPNESPADAALRELREETGYRAGRIRPIGSVWTTPGFCSEILHVFHADQLTEGAPAMDDDERIETRACAREAAWRLVARGTADAKTLLALLWLQGGEGEFGSHIGR
jgi:ADP-ribose pyrophosphatase